MALPELFRRRTRRWREFFYYFDLCGCQSLLIVLLICFLMGVVLGIQGELQMSKVGTEIFMVDLIGFSVLKELGPLMVAIIATGRAGSAFAAEIGTMKVNEELSALQTLGINPEGYLVIPKLCAMILTMPLLTFIGMSPQKLLFTSGMTPLAAIAIGAMQVNMPMQGRRLQPPQSSRRSSQQS